MRSQATRQFDTKRRSWWRTGAALLASFAAMGAGLVSAPAAEAAAGDGYISIHLESASEGLDAPFDYTISPAAGATDSFTLNDFTNIPDRTAPAPDPALVVNISDVAVSQDAANNTLWAVELSNPAREDRPVYTRGDGESQWQRVPGLSGVRVAGAATPESAFVLSTTTVTAWDGTTATNLGAPAPCTTRNIASNGVTLLVTCTSGAIYQFTGASFTTPGTAASWTRVTGAPVGTLVDINASNRVISYSAVTGEVNTYTLDPATHAVTDTPTASARANVADVAISPDGLYAIGGGYVYTGTDGATWTQEVQSRNATRLASGWAGRLWVVDPRGVGSDPYVLGSYLFSRNADSSYFDDQRIRTDGAGNTVEMAVAPGTYEVSQLLTAGWNARDVRCLGGSTSTSAATVGGSAARATITVGAGEHVSCKFVNVFAESTMPIGATCEAAFHEDFGTGVAGTVDRLPFGTTTYHYNYNGPGGTNDGYYVVATNAADAASFAGTNNDHTSNDGVGNFLFVNASYSPGIFYQREFTGAEVGTPYTFGAWLQSMNDQPILPNVTFRAVNPVTSEVLGEYSTGDITSIREWEEYHFTFTPTTGEFILEIVNNAVGGNGNDIGIDDITFGVSCAPVTLQKAFDGARPDDDDQFTMQLHRDSATGPVIGTTSAATTEGSGATVVAGTGTTTAQQLVDTPIYLTETPSAGVDPAAYLTARLTCVDANGVMTGLPTDAPFTGPYELVPVVDADITCTVTNVPKHPAISIVKSTTTTEATTPGQLIDYSFLVTNTGNEVLTDVNVTDVQQAPAAQSGLSAITCGPSSNAADAAGTLSPEATMTCTATYAVAQADLDHGSIVDTAVAHGTPSRGEPIDSGPSTVTVPVTTDPALTVVKSTSVDEFDAAGDVIDYSFLVTNTGNVTLSGVSVDDVQQAPATQGNLTPITCGPSSDPADAAGVLTPGATMTCRASYTVTQADVDHGSVTDAATAQGTPPGGGTPVVTPPSEVTVPASQNPAITILKSTTATAVANVGDEIPYSFLVTNSGNVTLTGVTVDDEQIAPADQAALGAITCGPSSNAADAAGTLSPGASMTCTATYTVSQADLDHGSIDDVATATGTPPTGGDVTSDPSEVSVPVTENAALSLTKRADTTLITDVGQQVVYTFRVTNTGNVTIDDVSVTDTQVAPADQAALTDLTCGASSVAGDAAGSLSPGAFLECTATYTVSQSDIDNGSVTDTATANGTPPGGPSITTPPAEVTVPAELTPALSIVKSTTTDLITEVGQEVPYTFVVTNTGNVTLSNVAVNDEQTAPASNANLSAITCGASSVAPGVLSPGASMTCAATYTVTQADVDNGEVTDVAIATGTPPGSTTPVPSGPSTVTVPVEQTPAITIVKSADVSEVTAAGDEITYSFVVTNTGDVTLSDVTVNDVQTAPALQSGLGAITCGASSETADPAGTLSPGASMTCTAVYTVSQADIDHGEVNDVATANGTPPGATTPITSEPSEVTVPATSSPSLAIVKTADRTTVTAAGQKIVYSFVVTNTGNVTVTDIVVTDEQQAPALDADLSPITCGASSVPTDAELSLSPGASMTCTATYTVSEADVKHGSITDAAVVRGTTPGGPVVSPPSKVTVTVTVTPPTVPPVKPAPPALPATGTTVPTLVIGAAVVLVLGGATLMLLRRRRRNE